MVISVGVCFKEYYVSTHKEFETVRITELAEEAVRECGISEGMCIIHLPHATAALILNEYEPHIASDYITLIKKLIPKGAGWRHDEIDTNAHAHLASAIIGSTKVLPVRNGRLVRGTWQELILIELDGPRRRRVVIEVIGR